MTFVAKKMCTICEIDLPVSWFPMRTQNGKKRRISWCGPCNRVYHKLDYQRNHEKQRRMQRGYHYKNSYGITVDDVEAMYAAQQGKCAICGTTAPGDRYEKFHVDHCHSTGRVRGLLCGQCNRGIGALGDDPMRVKAAADYLFTHLEALTP